MDEKLINEIAACEQKLRLAMLAGDTAALDELLSDDLIFTSHTGQLFGKADDIAAHKSGVVNIDDITVTDQKIRIFSGCAVASVLVHIKGRFAGNPHEADMRYTRIWAQNDNGSWQVIVAHASELAAA